MAKPRTTPRLGMGTKLGYGVGSVASAAAGTALATGTITLYLNQVIGLPIALVGVAIMISLIFDAVVDPLIGLWSDNTHSRWGRRHPFMYAAAIPAGLFVYLLWHTPTSWPKEATFALVIGVLIAVRFSVGLYTTTASALSPELAPDYNDRTVLISYSTLFGTGGGAVLAILLYSVFLRRDAAHPLGALNREGYAQFGMLVAVTITVAIIVAGLATHRFIPYLSPAKRPESFRASMRELGGAVTNPSLIVLIFCGVIGGMTNGITGTLNNYFYLHFWNLPPQTISLFVVAALPAAVLGAFLAPLASKWLGKKRAMIWTFAIAILAGLAPMSCKLLGFFPPDGSPWVLVILAADIFMSTILGLMGLILIASMIADVAEDVAVKTGKRSEGVLFAIFGLLPKISAAGGGFVATLLLAFVAFPARAQQGTVDPAIMRHLALIYLPISAILSFASILVMVMYKIDESTHEQNLAILTEQNLARLPEPVDDARPGGGFAAPTSPVAEIG
jgi:GPH family glycoside/pentoside/hexuronide:cation symporter